MTQVICPGCAKLVEVGILPPGTVPSCPFCGTIFQLPEPAPTEAAHEPSGHSHAAHSAQPRADGEPGTAAEPVVSGQRIGLSLLMILLCGGIAVVIVLLAIALLAKREQDRRDPQSRASSWQLVGKYSGHTHMETPPFRIASPVWRLTWACTAEQTPAKKSFQVRVTDDRGRLISTPVNSSGDEGETTLVESEPGMYALVIRATNVEWQLAVEHRP
jgi:hypothetical protein